MALDIVKNRKDAEDVAQENKEATCVGDTQAPSSLQPIFLYSQILTSSTSITNKDD